MFPAEGLTRDQAMTLNHLLYKASYKQVFGRSKFDRFLLEYDDERSGTFAPLGYVPDGRERLTTSNRYCEKNCAVPLQSRLKLSGAAQIRARCIPCEMNESKERLNDARG